jgi:hypothetical protein
MTSAAKAAQGNKVFYRSAEALRHPKADLSAAFWTTADFIVRQFYV